MTKSRSKILQGAKEALAYARDESKAGFRVHVPDEVDPGAVRRALTTTLRIRKLSDAKTVHKRGSARKPTSRERA